MGAYLMFGGASLMIGVAYLINRGAHLNPI